MHKGHRALINFILLELHTLDLLRNFASYTWHSRVRVGNFCSFQNNGIIYARHVHECHITLIKFSLLELHTLDLFGNVYKITLLLLCV